MNNKKPNIIYIYPDQLRYDSLGCSGNTTIKTPGFDRLAHQGVQFTNAYTSFPLCCPFRASLFTGKYPHAHGMTANHYPLDLEVNKEFLPEILNRNGYHTGWVGKWHLSGGTKSEFVKKEYRCGFQSFVGYTRGHEYKDSVYYRQDDPTPLKSNMYQPEYQTDHLFEFIEESVSNDQPFFAGICYGLPHPPLVMDPWYENLYRPEDIELSPTVPESEREAAKKFMAKYYGMITCVDNQLTRIVNYLDANNLSDNTMIIMASDHGELGGEHGRYMKTQAYEASMHVPFIVKYPNGFAQNHKCDCLADPSVDLFSTILDFCNIEIPDYAQGKSLMPCLTSDTPVREDIFYQIVKMDVADYEENAIPERGIRTEEYIYVNQAQKPHYLYNIKKDPYETENLVNDPAYQEMIAGFEAKIAAYMEKYQDNWDICIETLPENYATHQQSNVDAARIYASAVSDVPSYHRAK